LSRTIRIFITVTEFLLGSLFAINAIKALLGIPPDRISLTLIMFCGVLLTISHRCWRGLSDSWRGEAERLRKWRRPLLGAIREAEKRGVAKLEIEIIREAT